jgi:hypothetical protein
MRFVNFFVHAHHAPLVAQNDANFGAISLGHISAASLLRQLQRRRNLVKVPDGQGGRVAKLHLQNFVECGEGIRRAVQSGHREQFIGRKDAVCRLFTVALQIDLGLAMVESLRVEDGSRVHGIDSTELLCSPQRAVLQVLWPACLRVCGARMRADSTRNIAPMRSADFESAASRKPRFTAGATETGKSSLNPGEAQYLPESTRGPQQLPGMRLA